MAFETWADPNERKSLQRERQARLESSPIGSFQYVDVTFSISNTDTEIPLSTLKAAHVDAVNIRYIPVSQSAAMSIYRDTTASAKAWSISRIYLRSSATGTARILIFTEA